MFSIKFYADYIKKFKNDALDVWQEITKDKSKFRLYKPDSKKLDPQILAKAKNLAFNK